MNSQKNFPEGGFGGIAPMTSPNRDTFTAEPKRADDLNTQHRYNAACAAAQDGCGQGADAGKLDTKERARQQWQKLWQEVEALRQQAAAKTKPPTDGDQPQ
jgi:hypothetical protein